MKNVLKLGLSTLLFILVFTQLQAQGPGGKQGQMDPEKRAEQQTAMMTQKLGLSEAQATKIKEINLKYAAKAKTLREANTGGDRTAMRGQMTTLRTEQDAELKTMLTSDQWATWEKVQTEQRANRDERGKGSKRGNRSERGKKKNQAPPTGGQ